MSKSNVNYQGELLNAIRREGILVTIFLTSGFQLKGTVKAFDNYVILLDTDGKQQMIYKHAISTIAPTKPVKLNYNQCSIDGEDE